MKVYQLELIKEKQIFNDNFPPTYEVFLFESKNDAIKKAVNYCEKSIQRYDKMKESYQGNANAVYGFNLKKPDDLTKDSLSWLINVYVEDVSHEITLRLKENIVYASN